LKCPTLIAEYHRTPHFGQPQIHRTRGMRSRHPLEV
jgi:hypothetical protein